MSSFEVTFTGSWPNGDKPAALLSLSVPEVESLLNARFRAGQDDLDSLLELGVRLKSGRLVLLQRHDGSPNRGVTVYVERADNVDAALEELKRCLGISEDDVEWVAVP